MLNRRAFLALSGMAGAASFGLSEAASAAVDGRRQYYELRAYEVENETQRDGLLRFMNEAAIPALNRLGLRPVGVFTPVEDLGPVYVLIPHESAESAANLTQRLAEDERFLADGAEFLDLPATSPPYKRLENSMMLAFTGMPRIEMPATGPDRVFQLRIYKSPSEKTSQKKIEMFNIGEIDIFRKVGLNPVFFGETLFGGQMPNLTYMLGFDNAEAQKVAWDTFRTDPDWLELRAIPEYADAKILSGIINVALKPAAGSQI